MRLNLYDVKYVGRDFIILTDAMTEVKITFADTPKDVDPIAPTREEHARFFKQKETQVGLEAPVQSFTGDQAINFILDQQINGDGTGRFNVLSLPVAKIDLHRRSHE
jgi:hypothetical protein